MLETASNAIDLLISGNASFLIISCSELKNCKFSIPFTTPPTADIFKTEIKAANRLISEFKLLLWNLSIFTKDFTQRSDTYWILKKGLLEILASNMAVCSDM